MIDVDIYLVTCDRTWYLFATLDALHKNTRVRHRIFVADNASKNKEIRLILNRFKNNRRAIDGYIRFEKSRISARDDLIKRFPPKARYMVIMDDDFLVPRGWLGALMRCIEKRPEYGLLSLWHDIVDKPDPKNRMTPLFWKKRGFPIAIHHVSDGAIYRSALVEGLMFTPTSLFRKIKRFIRGRIYSRAVVTAGLKIGYLKEPLVRHIGYNIYYDYPSYVSRKKRYFDGFREH